MKSNITFNKQEQIQSRDPALQVTALIYLKDALVNEQYEQCAEFVRAAKRFGASEGEIKAVLTEGARALKVGRKVEAPQKKAGRRRF